MRRMSVLLFSVVLLSYAAEITPARAVEQQGQGIQWTSNFEKAMAQARGQNRPVLLDFFNPN
ncbi:MAG TPA: hypothetical protein VK463_11975 [Desulfomonilaceae bacterium]|nr:hypothetical protein [Desulfomonilaceae bacterium]